MALRWFLLLNLICSILLLVDVTHLAAQDTRKAYVVYMGDKPKNGVPILPDLHMNMLQDLTTATLILHMKCFFFTATREVSMDLLQCSQSKKHKK
ncbi:hypothetical protein RchiOBHm_Chr1g0325921 [Rosa chinensis]|uniref:Uncharacterized protein n=1 Tax=Rosa chinensis TaxID=74649 RepID=A0A2P6SA36_ROSCH|nr:hypothetical protein RchiOBHm_Chr1g0325921 [Rosa chinensis]